MRRVFLNVVPFVHELFKEFVSPGDKVVDATCGNGKDLVVLARLLAGSGSLIGYDIQQEALANTKRLCDEELSEKEKAIITLKKSSHEFLEEKGAKLFHYNLGYLPKGNHEITTKLESTLISLERALKLLHEDGLITMVCYLGHPEGKRETEGVEAFLGMLPPSEWLVCVKKFLNRNSCPEVFIIRRQRG